MNQGTGFSVGNVNTALLAVYISLGVVWLVLAVTLHLIYKRVRSELYLKYWSMAWYAAVLQLAALAVAYGMGDRTSRITQGICLLVGALAGYVLPGLLFLAALAMRGPISHRVHLAVFGSVFGLALAWFAITGVASSEGTGISSAINLLFLPRAALGSLASICFAMEYYRHHSARLAKQIRYLIPLLCIFQAGHQIMLGLSTLTNGSYSIGSVQAAMVAMLIGFGIAITLMYSLTLEAQRATSSKSAFLATMSHEMRTPLAGLIGLNTLLADSELNAVQRKLSDSIGQCGMSLLSLVDGILDLSRIEAGRATVNPVSFDPKLLIDEVISMLGATAANKGLTLEAVYESAMPSSVLTDRSMVKQILLNLVGNAIKFTSRGYVRVITSHHTTNSRPVWQLGVQDTGCGIPSSALPKLFEPFYQANNSLTSQSGTGLGLHLSRCWAKMLGAKDIKVRSEIGIGTTFSVAIPAPLSQAEPILQKPAVPQLDFGGLNILVAEDNKVNQHILLRLLEKLGHRVTAVSDGKQAIEAWQQSAPDLILMDMRMPGIDGLQATQQIRQLETGLQRIPIIAVTANAFEEDRQKCMAAQMDDYITKPITIEALGALITKWRAKQQALS